MPPSPISSFEGLFDALGALSELAPPLAHDAPHELRVTASLPARAVRIAPLPVVAHVVDAGFPSPADDYVEEAVDVLQLDAGSPSCYYVRVGGWSMRDEGIYDGDVLVVDRSLEPASGDVVVASVDGELTVKRFVWTGERPVLLAANPAYPPIPIEDGQELVIWGVVTKVVRDLVSKARPKRRPGLTRRGRPGPRHGG